MSAACGVIAAGFHPNHVIKIKCSRYSAGILIFGKHVPSVWLMFWKAIFSLNILLQILSFSRFFSGGGAVSSFITLFLWKLWRFTQYCINKTHVNLSTTANDCYHLLHFPTFYHLSRSCKIHLLPPPSFMKGFFFLHSIIWITWQK